MAKVMGIVNVTPDSFFPGSRFQEADALSACVDRMVSQGADAIDIGACSTRPDSQPVSKEEELERLSWALPIVTAANQGRSLLSVDTFRPDVARWCVREYGTGIVNDVSGGSREMFELVAETGVMYVLTFCGPTLNLAIGFFSSRLDEMAGMGIDIHNKVILDPGFGFGKTLDENWSMLAGMEQLKQFGLPVLAGLSRKSMAWKLLGISPEECLPATVAMNMSAMERGAGWIRVHDVLEGVQTARIFGKIRSFRNGEANKHIDNE